MAYVCQRTPGYINNPEHRFHVQQSTGLEPYSEWAEGVAFMMMKDHPTGAISIETRAHGTLITMRLEPKMWRRLLEIRHPQLIEFLTPKPPEGVVIDATPTQAAQEALSW